MAAYPLDRTRRFEVQGGFAETSFERITNSVTFVPATGRILSDKSVTEEFAARLDLVTAGVALVSDTANFGAAGPVRGQRYRLELAPAVGTISFTGVTLDYRRYVMPVSFYTIAFRVLHYGRYGDGSDDARLFPVYVNNPGLVRGYDSTYYLSSCLLTATGLCQVNDPLAGSRVLVSNVELRFPLLRPLGVSRAMYGPLPTEVAIFTDGGVAWTAREKPAIVGGTRPAITSVGIAIRTSVDVAVFEFDLARPLRRQGEGWVFGFNVIPAW
jgi:outer membrane protein assembly factor BamA